MKAFAQLIVRRGIDGRALGFEVTIEWMDTTSGYLLMPLMYDM